MREVKAKMNKTVQPDYDEKKAPPEKKVRITVDLLESDYDALKAYLFKHKLNQSEFIRQIIKISVSQ